MPIVTVKMLEGRTDEQKRALCEQVTDVLVETIGAKREAISIVIEEMAKNHYASGGKRMSDQ
ncbi:2-hydroxymuconate tautomerase [Sporosarcina sp. HYO08]|uniref:2-hydroxymuconate tautomerase n=1 Tax=Sporosarcina sp. HYO08 TaxID=1759557 RepID=UPI00079787A9|nr:2-hydroxymuconate tautomerase [Sporosarcina sp. HYO08]KXH83934.1 4-oxalocrotonate tautomerase [Sporosarcina sp. HYO08]